MAETTENTNVNTDPKEENMSSSTSNEQQIPENQTSDDSALEQTTTSNDSVEESASTETADDNAALTSDASTEESKELNETSSENETVEILEADASNQDSNESTEEETEEEIHVDVSNFSKQELIAYVESVLKEDKILANAKYVSEARDRYQDLFNSDRKVALEAFMAIEGNVEMDFQFPPQFVDRQWKEVYRNFGMRKKAIRDAITNEKETNLKKKNELLEQLKVLGENALEKDAFEKLKALQEEWRNIGQVPSGDIHSLNKNYSFLNDKFFEQRSIIREFMELDRKKNLKTKQEIILHLNELAASKDGLKDLMRHYRGLMDAWKDAGQVPKENLDEIMTAFRAANDKITERKNELIIVVDAERKENQIIKEAIIEKVLELTDDENELSWTKRNKSLAILIEAWKKSGAVPRSENQRIRQEFTDAVKVFNKLKNTFFKEQKRERVANIELREDAIKKVEGFLTLEGDIKDYRVEVINIQKYWRTIGHVPRKQSDELWEKFRAVCNQFFDKLKEGDNEKFKEQSENLAAKEAVCKNIEELATKEDLTQDDLIPFEEEWNKYGFVPFSKKKEIDKRYNDAVKQILVQTMKLSPVEAHLTDFKLKIESLIRQDNGAYLLDQEMITIRKKKQKQLDELNTLETNIQFFSNSKGADKLIAPIKGQITEIRKHLADYKDREKLLRESIKLLGK